MTKSGNGVTNSGNVGARRANWPGIRGRTPLSRHSAAVEFVENLAGGQVPSAEVTGRVRVIRIKKLP
jgi:hypothetical protein